MSKSLTLNEIVTDSSNVGTTSVERSNVQNSADGLKNFVAIVSLVVWYLSSCATLFSNKLILSNLNGEPMTLAMIQLIVSVLVSYVQISLNGKFSIQVLKSKTKMKQIGQDILFIGGFRCGAVVLSSVALKFIAVSFVATIRASAPIFTVVISRFVLGEKIGLWTKFSMAPISMGLALCSSFELSFHVIGFMSALGSNIFECFQSVYSKVLISGERQRYTAGELQFWACLFATFIQFPIFFCSVNIFNSIRTTSFVICLLYLFNGIAYHVQWLSSYVLLSHISPITFSVANTVKRALMIWLSILVFHNPMTFLSSFGTITVLFGVVLYNEARDFDKQNFNSSINNPNVTKRPA